VYQAAAQGRSRPSRSATLDKVDDIAQVSGM